MLSKRLEAAFKMTTEEHALAFERFANAFLLYDFPELAGIGGKKDKGIDARLVNAATGKLLLVVQSCVSPRTAARKKIFDTLKKLKGNMPSTFIYCTSATIGLSLDETKKELRQEGVLLDVYDSVWFIQRALTTEDRTSLCRSYASQVVNPLLSTVEPTQLYSEVLSENEERMAIQYLEAHSIDRARGRNLTKALFDALTIYVLRNSNSENRPLTVNEITTAIASMFPAGHHVRINEIVPARIKSLVKNKVVNYHTQEDKYILSYSNHQKLKEQLETLKQREITFRAFLREALIGAAESNEIDYDYNCDSLVQLGHNCILWYMREQGKQLQNPIENLISIFNTEELLTQYLSREQVDIKKKGLNLDVIMDMLPLALYEIISSSNEEIREYLRSKSDVFVSQAFLQATPDVQKACKKLLSRDIVYLGTTILIHCVAEKYTEGASRQLISTLETAKQLNIKIKTFKPFIEELVAHLKGPVLLEWINHFQDIKLESHDVRLSIAPKLIAVFEHYSKTNDKTVEDIVYDIIGMSNHVENAIEFLREEFGIITEEIPDRPSVDEQSEWEKIFGLWLNAKKRWQKMSEDRFELLVRHDVNAYTAIRQLRSAIPVEGDNYGHKIWLLTLDRMYWKIPGLLNKDDDFSYQVAMSMDYLISFVATLANMDSMAGNQFALPATLIVDDTDFIPAELRDLVVDELGRSKDKKYIKRRRVRELVHKTKTEQGGILMYEDVGENMEMSE